ncbi:ribosomal protein L19 [Dictyocaulus viviparus]|uniref:Large ribosomal subunit protein bL19m n=1 Tax=Dictyocaulus viviparus TaxID=29172 RepID=A0A0D8YDT4_DICVI|nr:ribosomal protein L19 [Dictyocaulus viviparus]
MDAYPLMDIRVPPDINERDTIYESLRLCRSFAVRMLETILRLPGLILLELWWRNRDISLEEVAQEMLNKAPFNSYLDISTILAFVHTRNFDNSAAIILSYSVLFLSVMFLTLPLSKLFKLYTHAFSLMIFAFAHYMSTTYVNLEQNSKDVELKLDTFVKLERHGFHFLAQLMLSVVQSCVLGLESDVGRAFLTVFTLPIVARMSGLPLEKLIIAHNIACSLVMLFICIYVLNRVPDMVHGMRTAFRQVKAIFVVRGLAGGFATVWRRLRIAELMTCGWLTMFAIRLYVEIWEKRCTWREAGPALLASIAESTNTPISLLSLALTVSFVCKWVVDGTQLVIGGRRDHGHVLAHSGLVYGSTDPRSAVSPNWFAGYENGAEGLFARSCIIYRCVIIVSNCVLTTIHAASSTVQYAIGMIESRSSEPWECSDDLMFWTRMVTKIFELSIALIVLVYGIVFTLPGNWTLATVAVLVFHVIFNIYRRMETLLISMTARQAAVNKVNRLSRASKNELQDRSDVCAICFMEMWEEARVTPCKHFFHGACLRKWLYIKQVCPLCYSELLEPERESSVEAQRSGVTHMPNNVRTRSAEMRELRGMEGARDMWPLMGQVYENDSESETNSSSATEYTLETLLEMAFHLPPVMRLTRAYVVQILPCRNSVKLCPSNPPKASRKKYHRLIYPDFLQSPVWNRRNKLKEELEHQDMLERRVNIDIPEFYVGSVLAVTTNEKYLGSKQNRFVGICIRREKQGLHHQFTLRNVIEGIGVEVLYDLYNPTIKSIETLKLEKRLDNDLSYLVDALPEYSTFDFNMESISHPAGTPVPINPIKAVLSFSTVKLRPPPWARRWELYDYKGIDGAWEGATPYFKRKFHRTKMNDYLRYDLIADYRVGSELEHELKVEERIRNFEKERNLHATRRRILRSAASSQSNLSSPTAEVSVDS